MHVPVPINLMQTALKTNRRLHSLTETYLKKNTTNPFSNTRLAESIFQWCIAHFSISRSIIRVSLVIITHFFSFPTLVLGALSGSNLRQQSLYNEVTICVVIEMPGLVSIMKKNRDTCLKTLCSLISERKT